MKAKKYRSAALSAIHETMTALHEAGAVSKQTMREFDAACLTPVQLLSAAQIKSLRLREHIRRRASRQYAIFGQNPRHPSLQLKQVGEFWSARVNDAYRALAVREGTSSRGSASVRMTSMSA